MKFYNLGHKTFETDFSCMLLRTSFVTNVIIYETIFKVRLTM